MSHAIRLREAWLARRIVRVALRPDCVIPMVVGRVTGVSVVDGAVFVDGWHVPLSAVVGVGKPTLADVENYAHAMHALREEAGNHDD